MAKNAAVNCELNQDAGAAGARLTGDRAQLEPRLTAL